MAFTIPASLRAAASSAMADVFEAFKMKNPDGTPKMLRVYTKEGKTFIADDPNYIEGFGLDGANTVIAPSYVEMEARVFHPNIEPVNYGFKGEQRVGAKVEQTAEVIQVQVKGEENSALVRNCKALFWDGKKYKLVNDVLGFGILGIEEYFNYIFERNK